MNRIVKHPIVEQNNERKLVSFTFNGTKFQGFENEMLSSALFANNIKEFSIHRVEDAPQGIFCANGQCSQCTVIIDGKPLKSCITPLKENMVVNTLKHIPELPEDDKPIVKIENKELKTDVLVIGAGPSGLTATIELAKLGFNVILVEDKDELGGKLLLQTHKFFGSEEDCYAGTRGMEIGHILEEEVKKYDNVTIFYESSVVAIYKDQKAGVFVKNKNYLTIEFEGLLISAGARERSLVFPGNDLPGVYGAGAFQTLVNRDLIKAADRVFIVGSGNVGLIGAYHALQAGIEVVGIIDIMDKISGYKVHSDKIQRMGVPLNLNTTIISAEGDGKVEKITVAQVDKNWNPILETAKTYAVDTLLIAAGLTPVDEFYDMAKKFGFKVLKAGDADEIAEASSAMFGGRIAGLNMAKLLGKDVIVDKSFTEKADVLKSKPGKIFEKFDAEITDKFVPIFHCIEEIPCNPCITVCPKDAISLKDVLGNIMDVPYLSGECIGCGICVAACPGLAITLTKTKDNEKCEVMLPHEFNIDFEKGDLLKIVDMFGEFLEEAEVVRIRINKKYKTPLITVKMSEKFAAKAAGIEVQKKEISEPLEETSLSYLPDNGIVCRCERVTVGEIKNFIKENNVRDVNQLKLIRVGMGACGSKTCSVLLPRVFREAGVDYNNVKPGTIRPLTVEVPMNAIINEK